MHPLDDRRVPVILGEHVTLEVGTGAVHTAPGHGQDDFAVGQRYGLAVVNPVGNDGRFLPGTALVAGLKVWEADLVIIESLRQRGRLLHYEPYRHSYPHCWRHKTPGDLPRHAAVVHQHGAGAAARAHAARHQGRHLDARLGRAAHQRHDRRAAGLVHLAPAHVGRADPAVRAQAHRRAAPAHAGTDRSCGDARRAGGIEAWFALEPAELLGAEAADYDKVSDVMDVWADSGLSFECVGAARPEVAAPVDLYLEGSDQHRGWFHSSLLMSEALYERAPYRGVLTHGFTVDEKGRKMSKSLGNVIAPQKVMNSLGADVLRLWVAATDYANEIAVSDEILKRMADSYRRMRNTLRFLLGNLHDFDPAQHLLPSAELVALDRWALTRCAQLQAEVVEAYRNYSFHLIYQKVHNFCIVDLGGFYLDVIKDRLYTTPAAGRARRSAQSAMFHLAESMVRWLAPILSFTAEEVWSYLPGEHRESVFHETWHVLPPATHDGIDWPALIALRTDVMRELEKLRDAGSIGGPLDAQVDVYCTPPEFARFAALGAELRFLLITSHAHVHAVAQAPAGAVPAASTGSSGVWIVVQPAHDPKCVRCWHHRADVGADSRHPQLCTRCVSNIEGPGEQRNLV